MGVVVRILHEKMLPQGAAASFRIQFSTRFRYSSRHKPES